MRNALDLEVAYKIFRPAQKVPAAYQATEVLVELKTPAADEPSQNCIEEPQANHVNSLQAKLPPNKTTTFFSENEDEDLLDWNWSATSGGAARPDPVAASAPRPRANLYSMQPLGPALAGLSPLVLEDTSNASLPPSREGVILTANFPPEPDISQQSLFRTLCLSRNDPLYHYRIDVSVPAITTAIMSATLHFYVATSRAQCT